MVRVSHEKSFVIADIPGLIEGASDGAGLGIQFLRHLQRTRLLLHIVDLAPFDNVDPVKDCLLYTSPSPRDLSTSRMPSSA